MEDSMTPKTVVITGASSGIGAELAVQLGKQGHNLVLAARREPELKQVALKSGANAIAFVCDVTIRGDIQNLLKAAIAKFGRVDIWVNNAGRGIGRGVMEITDEDFDEIMSINVKSAIYGMQTVIPHFKENGRGHLINVSSFLGRIPFVPFRSVYNAAKTALNVLTSNLRMELAEQYPHIHVSTVMPGMVFTDFTKNALHGTPKFTPIKGWLKPQTAEEAVATMVELIANPKAELYTNPAMQELVDKYYHDVAAFEEYLRKAGQ
jgi:NAD(P)-dependent dehydrogenase (short-subunit alcohol dehydrogenase family)